MTGKVEGKRAGYKKTEVGWIPEDWEIKSLEQVCEILYGKDQKEVQDDGGEFNIFGTSGIIGKSKAFIYDKPSVLIGRKGTIDKPMFTNKPFWAVDTLFYTKIFINIAPKWFYFFMKNINLKKFNEATGVPSLSKSTLLQIKLIVPPLFEQQKIAAILSTVDEKIDAIDTEINAIEKLKKALMRQLLTRGIGHTEFKETEIGKIPKDWEVKGLLSLTNDGIQNGAFNDPQKVGKGYKLINVVNLYSEPYIKTDKLNLLELDENEMKKYKVNKDDIFFTRSSLNLDGIAHCNINISEEENLIFECHIMRIRPKKEIVSPHYLRYYCVSKKARKYLMSHAKQVTMTTISQSDIAPMPIPLPSLAEQQKIADILSTVDEKLDILREKKETYQTLKKGLMQQLLTGALRVTNVHLNPETRA